MVSPDNFAHAAASPITSVKRLNRVLNLSCLSAVLEEYSITAQTASAVKCAVCSFSENLFINCANLIIFSSFLFIS